MEGKKKRLHFMEICYKLYESKMYYVAYSVLQDVQMAEDAVQNAFMTMMRKEVYFENAASDECKRYMIRVIRNAAIDQYRRNRKEQERMYLVDDETILELGDAEWGKGDTVVAEDHEKVSHMLKDLPAKYVQVMQCRVIEELSVKETAQKLHISEASVRKRYERARKMLKKQQEGGMEYEQGQHLYNA